MDLFIRVLTFKVFRLYNVKKAERPAGWDSIEVAVVRAVRPTEWLDH